MNHLTLRSSDQQPSAGRKGGVFVHEVEEEYLFEGKMTQHCNCIHFLHEILMDKLVLGVPLNAIVESLGDGKQLHELNEPVEGLIEGLDDGLPPLHGRIIDLHLKGEWNVGLNRSYVGNDCRVGQYD
jgi:hypothetical protein